LPRRPSQPPSRPPRKARTEARPLVWRQTRSILAFSAGSKESDLVGKAAESAHRQPQADVVELVFILGRCMVSQSLAMASPSPVILDSRERSAAMQGQTMAKDLSMLGMTPLGLRASSRVRPTRQERRPDDRGRSGKGIGPRGPWRSAWHCSPVATVVQRPLPAPPRSRYDQ
jgi:hypothetical protein